jgi:DNA-binding transcriptional LysR family regulator
MPYDGRLLSGVTVLMAVVEAGSMARAAEALGLTSSGVGRAIARLETRVGVRLLERTTRTMMLTDEGRRFYEEVGPHLDGIEQAAMTAAGAASAVRGRLRVNVDPFFSRVVLAGQIATFLDAHPHLRLDLVMRDHVGDLVADGFDLALRFGEPSGSLVARKLIETRILTVASPGFVARHGRPRHPSDLARLPCIEFYDAARACPFEWEFRKGRRFCRSSLLHGSWFRTSGPC